MSDKKITKTIMKNISEMNQDEKRELLKKIEENRLEQIKKVKETLENLNSNPKEY
jgi:predicted transcriptional regulator